MKTILYIVTQSEFGGAQKYIYDLASNLSDEYRIGVIAGCETTENEFAKKLKEHDISYYCINSLKRSISPIKDIITIFKLVQIIKIVKPSIVHLNSSKISIIGSLACFITKSWIYKMQFNVIYTVHGWVFLEPLNKIKIKFYKLAESIFAKFKDTIICINKKDLDIAQNILRIPKNKLKLISNGINNKKINFLNKKNALLELRSIKPLKNINLESNTLLIGLIGNLYPTKDYENFIKAFKISKTALQVQIGNETKIKAIIIGKGLTRNKLEKLITSENLSDDIYLAGAINNAGKYLKAFDIYVSSSVKEGLPYSILEAGLAERAVVATNVGGVPDILSNNYNGLLVEPSNSQALAKSISELIYNAEKRKKYGINLKTTVENAFNINSMIKKTNNIYK